MTAVAAGQIIEADHNNDLNTTLLTKVPIKLDEKILLAPAPSVSFNPVASTYRTLRVTWTARDDWTGFNADSIHLRINNDSGGFYRHGWTQTNNASVTGGSSVAQTRGLIGITARGGAGAGVFGAGQLVITGWNAPHGTHLGWVFSSGIMDSAVGTCWTQTGSGLYVGTGPFTRLDILPDPGAANFATGSQFVLEALP